MRACSPLIIARAMLCCHLRCGWLICLGALASGIALPARATSSPVIGTTYDPRVFASTVVGDITLVFSDANNAVMTYSLDGVTQSKAITRLPY